MATRRRGVQDGRQPEEPAQASDAYPYAYAFADGNGNGNGNGNGSGNGGLGPDFQQRPVSTDYLYGTEERPDDVALSAQTSKAEMNEFVSKVLGWHVFLVLGGFGAGLGVCKALEKTKMMLLEEGDFAELKSADTNLADYAFYGVYGVLLVLLMASFIPKISMRTEAMAAAFSFLLMASYAVLMVFCFMHFRSSFVKEFYKREAERREQEKDSEMSMTLEQFNNLRVSMDIHVFKGVCFYAAVFLISALSVSMMGVDFIRPHRIFVSGIAGFFFTYLICKDYPLSYVFNMGVGVFMVFVPALVILGIQKFIVLGKPRHSEWMAVAVIAFFDIPRTLIATLSPDQ